MAMLEINGHKMNEYAYSGKRDGCTFSPPYSAAFRIREGTKRPNETATMRFMDSSLDFGS